MRRFAIITLAAFSAACGANQVNVGETTVSFTTPASPDTLLARAAAELTQLGFQMGGREQNLIFTAPRPLPDSIAGTVGGDPQQWFIHVTADPQVFAAGSTGVVRAYLIPLMGTPSPGNSVTENVHPVSDDRPAVFRELRRVSERLQVAATRGLLR